MEFTPFFKKYISAILCTLVFIVMSYNYITYCNKWGTDRTYCGTIVAKISRQEGSYKHSYQVDHFLIKFDGVNRNYDLKPSINDFYFHKEGDRVCYDLSPSEILQDRHITSPGSIMLLGAFFGLVSFILLAALWLSKIFNW